LVIVKARVLVEPTEVEGKLNEVADSFATGPVVEPVPERLTVCGDPVALSVMFSVAENVPAAAGVNVTWAVQDLPAASALPPQLLVWLKSLALLPV
jgi:hypothetical protein